MTHEWACVPDTGRSNILPASTFEVDAQPPTMLARDAHRPPPAPWARRRPNSATGAPCAARHTRAALVAMSVWKFTQLRSAASSSWHCIIGPLTRTRGSFGNTTCPSGTASISTVSLKSRSHSRKSAANNAPPPGAGIFER